MSAIRTLIKRHIASECLCSDARVPASTLRFGAQPSHTLHHSIKVLVATCKSIKAINKEIR